MLQTDELFSTTSGPFTGYYTPSMAGTQLWDDGRQSIAFSTKTDFDLSGCEKFAEIETRDQLPKSIPIKDNDDEFIVDGQGTYTYDGRDTRSGLSGPLKVHYFQHHCMRYFLGSFFEVK